MPITQKINTFFREVWVELKKTSWLSQKEVLRYTFVVLGFTVVVAAFLGGLDYIFSEIIKRFIFRQ
jgi:preprotein translocase subunit SecE